jgi:hypothetical protein
MKKNNPIDLVRITLKNGKVLVFSCDSIDSVIITSPIKKIETLRAAPTPQTPKAFLDPSLADNSANGSEAFTPRSKRWLV